VYKRSLFSNNKGDYNELLFRAIGRGVLYISFFLNNDNWETGKNAEGLIKVHFSIYDGSWLPLQLRKLFKKK